MAREATRVSLERLLNVVVLSPAQASLVAARLLDATGVRGMTNGTEPGRGCLWSVVLTPSGEVEVTRAGPGEGAPAGELLERLRHHARRLPAHPRPEQLALLRRLEEAIADRQLEPGARARGLEDALVEALGPDARQRLAGQLAALVGAFAHISPSVGLPVGALAGQAGLRTDRDHDAPERATRSRSPWRAPSGGPRRGRRRMAVAALLLAAALVGSGFVMLRTPDDGRGGSAGQGEAAGASPSTTVPSDSSKDADPPRPRSRPRVATLADRQTGPVTGVEVAKTGSCTPGAPCPVTVTVRFRPTTTARPVTWRVGTARLCRSGLTWGPPTTVIAQPGWTSVYASSSVAIPEGRSLALVAVTSAPARAQSPPVPVTGSSLRC